ncbi:MAG: hypothetical protein JO370_14825 [Paucibacter sp.]|nr:hypothetical protein [Roseateles sp.]
MQAQPSPSERTRLPRKLLVAVVVAAAVLGLLLAGRYLRELLGKSEGPKKPPKISLVAPPPPPPPPPPKFEKKPDPPKEQKEIKVPQPVPQQSPQPPAPSQDLKMDGPAGNGPSAFSSGGITSEDLSHVGTGNGGNGSGARTGMFNPFTNYANLAKGELQRFLNKKDALKHRRYSLEVHLWMTASGSTINRVELVGGTGDAETDDVIRQILAALPPMSQPAPTDMPMPIRLRITTGA